MSDQTAAEPDAAPPQEPMTAEQMMQAATDRITALEAELAEMKERWMRAEAENANVRNRAKKDVDDTRQYAVQKFATDVVEAAENLKRGIDSLPPHAPDQPNVTTRVPTGGPEPSAASAAISIWATFTWTRPGASSSC